VPTLSTGAAFIGATTISKDGDSNFVNRLIKCTNKHGEPVFSVISITMVCASCTAKGEELQCRHMLGLLPEWQTQERFEEVRAMMGTEESIFATEMLGQNLADRNKRPAFDSAGTRRLRTPEAIFTAPDGITVSQIFVSIDPAAGGSRSQYAIVTAFYHDGKMVIVGAEAKVYRHMKEALPVIARHVNEVRALPGFEDATAVFVPESNLGFEAQNIQEYINERTNLVNTCFMMEDGDSTTPLAGIRMTNKLKQDMITSLDLRLAEGDIYFYDQFVCITETADDIKERLIEQLEAYCIITTPSRLPHGQPTVTYSGKEGYGWDDLAIAVQINPVAHRRFHTNTLKYRKWH
jgi:hypothetical protein